MRDQPSEIHDLAIKLRQARKQMGLSQRELANVVNIDPSYLSKLERGKDLHYLFFGA